MQNEALKQSSGVVEMFGVGGAGDHYVIEVDKKEVKPPWTKSISHWNVCAAFLRPNGMHKDSNNPNGGDDHCLGNDLWVLRYLVIQSGP